MNRESHRFDGDDRTACRRCATRTLRELVATLETQSARLDRRVDALARALGVDIDSVIARDDAERRGFPLYWDEFVALDLDPSSGEPSR